MFFEDSKRRKRFPVQDTRTPALEDIGLESERHRTGLPAVASDGWFGKMREMMPLRGRHEYA